MTHWKKRQKTWEDLTAGQRVGAVVAGAVQILLALAAWADLAKRPAAQVNGKKGVWAAVIAIDVVGPITYFLKGRRTS